MKNYTRKPDNFLPARRQAGLSLVELMISLTIGLVLLTGITTLIVQQSATRNELEKSSRQIENGRYAMQILHDDIEHAGFYGEYSPPATTTYTVPADPCDTTVANLGWDPVTPSVPVAISGYTGASTAPAVAPACVANLKAGTAILIVRRTATSTVAAAVGGTTYLQVSRCNTEAASTPFLLGTGGFTLRQKDCATTASLRPYIVRIYYVSTCSVCGTDTIPTLKVVEFMNGTQTVIPLVEGIENMQFDYGIAASTTSSSPATYTMAPATAADWSNVMTVRVNLLARNNDPTTGYTDTKSYTLGSTAVAAANDPYKRHVYSELVRVINPSGRRE